jgi:hypothetical protein
MYRTTLHRRKGHCLVTVSSVDCIHPTKSETDAFEAADMLYIDPIFASIALASTSVR